MPSDPTLPLAIVVGVYLALAGLRAIATRRFHWHAAVDAEFGVLWRWGHRHRFARLPHFHHR